MVTRKDLNEIAKVFNTRIKSYLLQGEYDKAKATWFTAISMYNTLVVLNPKVEYVKWRDAIIKGFAYEELFVGNRAMTDDDCINLATHLFDSGANSDTVSKDVLTLDTNPCTDADWKVVVETLQCLEEIES